MKLRASEIAHATGGALVGPDVVVDGAAIDTRALEPGQLFVPIVAERDGHEFIGAAIDAGAAAYLTEQEPVSVPGTAVVVTDTTAALQALGRHARSKLDAHVIGITGSVGKTTVKDLLSAVTRTRFATSASVRSFNNELGVPLTLVNAPDGTEVLVVEKGARGRGHIAELCRITSPTIGVVTRVAAAHTELFGTLDDVAAAKGELVEALPPDGVAVLNAADPRVSAMADRTSARVLRFGEGGDVVASGVVLDDELRARFRIDTPWGAVDVRLAVRGAHQVDNALAAAAAGLAAGVEVGDVAAGLAEAIASPWRMELTRLRSGLLVLNDAYNANPESMRAALQSLLALDAERRVAVLGPMAELGDRAADDHREIGDLALASGVRVIGVRVPGESAFDELVEAYGGDTVDSIPEAAEQLRGLGAGDAVLVKASRVAGLERILELLEAPAPSS